MFDGFNSEKHPYSLIRPVNIVLSSLPHQIRLWCAEVGRAEEDELVDILVVVVRLDIGARDEPAHGVSDDVDFVAPAHILDLIYFCIEQSRGSAVRKTPLIRKREERHALFIPVRHQRINKIVVGMRDWVDKPLAVVLRRAENSWNYYDWIRCVGSDDGFARLVSKFEESRLDRLDDLVFGTRTREPVDEILVGVGFLHHIAKYRIKHELILRQFSNDDTVYAGRCVDMSQGRQVEYCSIGRGCAPT